MKTTQRQDLAILEITNKHGFTDIATQGAQVLSWTPAGEKPVIWLSPAAKYLTGKSARGGVPICWPWFGAHPDFPAHGFARNSDWNLLERLELEDGSTRLKFGFTGTFQGWPHTFGLEFTVTSGKVLEMELVTRNTGDEAFVLGQALHTYFTVGDVREISLLGLEDCEYLDKVDEGKLKKQSGPVKISSEVDRIYLDTTADCVIVDPLLQRKIRIEKKGSASTVVWNPWIEKAEKMGDLGENGYLNMLCVESCNCATDTVTLQPGESHSLWVRYSVEKI